MTRGALLVDWGNVAIGRDRAGYGCHDAGEVAQRLVQRAREHAESHDVDLYALETFVPARELDPALRDVFRAAGLALCETPQTPDAADHALLSRAFELRFAHDVSHFVIASGDGIFCIGANVLDVGGARCDLWPFSRGVAARTVLEWPQTRFLSETLGLRRCPRNDEDPALRIAIGLHVIGRGGRGCASATVARRDLAATEMFEDLDRATSAWSLAETLKWFAHDPARGGNDPRGVRRLAYEHTAVIGGLLVGDAIIRAVETAGAVDAEALADHVQHPLARDRIPAIATLLQDAGVLATGIDGRVRIADPDLGPQRLVEGIQRAVVTMLNTPEKLKRSTIASEWPRHHRRLRESNRVQAQTRACGSDAVRLAAAAGALRRVGDQNYAAVLAHPLTAATKAAAEAAVRVIDAVALPVPIDTLQARLQDLPGLVPGTPLCGWSADERRILLSALAGAKHIVIAGPAVTRLLMTPFVQRTLDAR